VKPKNNPAYIVEAILKPIGDSRIIECQFGDTKRNDVLVSSMYEISVLVKSVENAGETIVSLESAKYYSFRGGQYD
jgi:hypothetical protein